MNIRLSKWHYLLMTFLLFGIEILIALFAHDRIVRPYVGDFLVVILMYCFARSFLHTPYLKTAVVVLCVSYLIEVLQYLDLVRMLGLQHSAFARTVIGTSFEWIDLVAYTLGISLVIVVERKFVKQEKAHTDPSSAGASSLS